MTTEGKKHAVIRNWRDQEPRVGHINAVVWGMLGSANTEGEKEDLHCMQGIAGIAKHAVQSGKGTDYHSHPDAEQVYCILKGNGVMFIDDERRPVREGDIVYLPPNCKHQMLNESDDWVEHYIMCTVPNSD